MQQDLFSQRPAKQADKVPPATAADGDQDRALIDQLIADTQLYDSSERLRELMAFTVRLRHIAPFNAMLLHVQKPGLSFARDPPTGHAWAGGRNPMPAPW